MIYLDLDPTPRPFGAPARFRFVNGRVYGTDPS